MCVQSLDEECTTSVSVPFFIICVVARWSLDQAVCRNGKINRDFLSSIDWQLKRLLSDKPDARVQSIRDKLKSLSTWQIACVPVLVYIPVTFKVRCRNVLRCEHEIQGIFYYSSVQIYRNNKYKGNSEYDMVDKTMSVGHYLTYNLIPLRNQSCKVWNCCP